MLRRKPNREARVDRRIAAETMNEEEVSPGIWDELEEDLNRRHRAVHLDRFIATAALAALV